MGAVTYPEFYVAKILNELFIPVQVNVEKADKLTDKYGVVWTPNINILDEAEKLTFRVEGWLPPGDYLAMLLVGKGHYFLANKRYEEALASFREAWNRFPRSAFAAEALYYWGVGGYLASHDLERLTNPWKDLQKFHPYSLWATKTNL